MQETNENKNLKKVMNLIAITFMGLFLILGINTAITLYEILGENSFQQLYIIFVVGFIVCIGLYSGIMAIYYLVKGLKYTIKYLKGR